ncbi:hypothetical protein AWV80_36885 [Cupriavidus sp. UYMU48A]|nr:hypothetical protein AWV80_36885 [Cupriavidus sp. UYMU48A]
MPDERWSRAANLLDVDRTVAEAGARLGIHVTVDRQSAIQAMRHDADAAYSPGAQTTKVRFMARGSFLSLGKM